MMIITGELAIKSKSEISLRQYVNKIFFDILWNKFSKKGFNLNGLLLQYEPGPGRAGGEPVHRAGMEHYDL